MITKISILKEKKSISVPNIPLDKGLYFIVNEKGSTMEFIIQDKAVIYGYAELLDKNTYYSVVNVAAIKGYGPLLYDSIMLYLNKPVQPNASLTGDAYNVWNNYFANRSDVYKTNATNTYKTLDYNKTMTKAPEFLNVANTVYTIKDPVRKKEMKEWYSNSKNFEREMITKLPNWVDVRFRTAKRWFADKYTTIL